VINVFLRAIILYALVVTVMRLMGKRQVGELQPFEFTIALLIADLASVPMADLGTPLLFGIIPIASLLLAQMTLAYITMKSSSMRSIICGKPSIIIHKGTICEKTMKAQRYNLSDLLEQLRSAGYFKITDVEYAILETGGFLTVIPKAESRPLTAKDMNITPTQDDLPINIIMDGKVDAENVEKYKINMDAVKKIITDAGFHSTADILIAVVSNGKDLFIQGKQPRPLVIKTTLEAQQ